MAIFVTQRRMKIEGHCNSSLYNKMRKETVVARHDRTTAWN